jgi:hypothetical protein
MNFPNADCPGMTMVQQTAMRNVLNKCWNVPGGTAVPSATIDNLLEKGIILEAGVTSSELLDVFTCNSGLQHPELTICCGGCGGWGAQKNVFYNKRNPMAKPFTSCNQCRSSQNTPIRRKGSSWGHGANWRDLEAVVAPPGWKS